MYISLNPLFNLGFILAAKESAIFPQNIWTTGEGQRIAVFSRGQWAIKEFASKIIHQKGRRGIVFVPEYFCEISLTTLRQASCPIYFYRITPDFEPNIGHLHDLAKKHGTPDILLYVHYFGFPSRMHITQEWCEKNETILVEDAAHTIVPIPGIGESGNPVIYTPWKFFNIPEGALLVLPERFQLGENVISLPKGKVLYPLKWMAKQLIISLCHHMRFPLHKVVRKRIKGYDESEQPIDPKNPECSVFSLNILSRYGQYIDKIRSIRERNYKRLDEIFLKTDISMYRIFKRVPALFAPYVYPLRVPADISIDIITALNKKGIPAAPWSDLSPEVKNSQKYPLSNALRREVITLPIHQDLTLAHIEWMAEEVIKSFKLS